MRIVLVQSCRLMPRRFLKKICPSPDAVQKRWYLRPFGDRITDPRLWTLHRRAVTSAFGVGLAICFIPLPVHLLVAGLIAIAWRINLPAMYGATLLVNPVTCIPVYYVAYRVGATMLGTAPLARDGFQFHPSLHWFETSLQPVQEALPPGMHGVRGGDGHSGLAGPGAHLALACDGEVPDPAPGLVGSLI